MFAEAMLRKLFYELTSRFPSHLNRIWMAQYNYMFTPAQLAFLVRCLEETKILPGPIVEVGCARGQTTLYLNKHLLSASIQKPYICIDTFEGFTRSDIRYEIEVRKKDPGFTWNGFSYNKKRWFDRALEINGIGHVQSMKADVNTFAFQGIENISFCLLDVDLYLPVKSSLGKLAAKMARGGILVIDDCAPDSVFDGALQAYQEFIAENSVRSEIVCGKLAVLYF
jgi:O-methyltransferase